MADARTIATYDARAAEYATLLSLDKPDDTLQAFIDLIAPGGRVLDLGCGPGAASAHMRDAGLRPDPIDASEGMIAIARAKFKLDARIATFDDIGCKDVYDGIWANFSLLHAPREKLAGHIAALVAALRQGGVFHIGMKTGEETMRDAIDRYYTLVTVDTLEKLLSDAGLRLTFQKEGIEKGLAGTMDPYVIMRGEKSDG